MTRPTLRFPWPAALAAAAVLLWSWSLVDGGGGRRWLLEDRSDSMAGERAPEGEADPGSRFHFADGLRAAEAAAPASGASRLGAALEELRPRLVAGDQLVVWSDGRATDELPDPAGFAGVEFVWRRPGPRPRFGHVEAPAFLPASGRLQIAVEVVDGDPAVGQLEVAAAAPAELLAMETRSAGAAGGVARIELDLAVAGELGGAAGLRLRWRQRDAVAERQLRLAAPGQHLVWGASAVPAWAAGGGRWRLAPDREQAQVLFPDPAAGTPQLDAALRRGALVVAESRSLPHELRPLRPWTEDGGGVLVLIDLSGSMEGRPFAEALEVLARWGDGLPPDARFQVRAFAADLGPAADPRRPEEWAALAARRPFGPTGLAGALRQAAEEAAPRTRLVLIGDGQAEAPAEGWPALGAALAQSFSSVRCVPVGDQPDRAALAAIGDLMEDGAQGSLEQRLQRNLEALAGEVSGAFAAVPGALWSLPASLETGAPVRRQRAAPGAEVLLRHGDGSVGAALLRTGGGVVLGLAGPPADPAWAPLVAAIASDRTQPRLGRRGRWLHLAAEEAVGWTAAGADGRRRPFDRVSPGLWRCGPFPAAQPLELQPPGAPPFRLAGTPAREQAADDGPWRRWLLAQAAVRQATPARPGLLGAALGCAVLALGAARRRRAGAGPPDS